MKQVIRGFVAVALTVSIVGAQTASSSPMTVADAMAAIQKAADQPQPPGMSAADAAAWSAQTEWLRDVHRRLGTMAAAAQHEVVAPRDRATGQASGRVAPREQATGQASGRREQATGQASGQREQATGQASGQVAAPANPLEDLRSAIQNESRKFQTLSNASRARHEAAMNAIRNMKG